MLQGLRDGRINLHRILLNRLKRGKKKRVVEKLKKAGVKTAVSGQFGAPIQWMGRVSSLKDKQFVLTGTLSEFTRDEAKELIENLGGRITSTVSKKTDYVIAGAEPGSKYDKAKELDIKTLNEAE